MRLLKLNPPDLVWPVALLAATIPTYLIRFEILHIPTTLWEILLWVVFLSGLAGGALSWTFWRADRLRWPILLILLASLIALAVSPNYLASLGQWKAIILDGLIFYWLVRSVTDGDKRACYWLTGGAVLGGVLVAVEALALAPLLNQVASDGRRLGIYMIDAGASPNYLALYLSPLVLLTLVGISRPASQLVRIFSLVAMIVLVLAVLVSGSRAGIVAILAGLIMAGVWLLGRHYPARRAIIGAAASLLIVTGLLIVGPSFLPDPNIDPTTANRLTSSNNIRLEIWRTTATRIIPTNPIWGIGWANFQPLFGQKTAGQVNYPEYISPYALHPHNFFLMTWVTLGLIGLAGWLILLGLLAARLPRLATWQIPIMAALIAWLVQGLVDTPFYKNDLAALWWLLVALMMTYQTSGNRSQPQLDR